MSSLVTRTVAIPHSVPAQKPLPDNFAGVQYLRAVAASMVVLFHSEAQLSRAALSMDSSLSWLASGVDIFFVISGFIMWTSTAPPRSVRPLEFWRRRIWRIVPLYWIVTTFMIVVLLIFPAFVKTGQFEVWHAVTSFLFLPSIHPVTGMLQPVLVPGWS